MCEVSQEVWAKPYPHPNLQLRKERAANPSEPQDHTKAQSCQCGCPQQAPRSSLPIFRKQGQTKPKGTPEPEFLIKKTLKCTQSKLLCAKEPGRWAVLGCKCPLLLASRQEKELLQEQFGTREGIQGTLRRQSWSSNTQCSSSPASDGPHFTGLSDFLLNSSEVLPSLEVNAIPNQGLQQSKTFPKFQELLGYSWDLVQSWPAQREDISSENSTYWIISSQCWATWWKGGTRASTVLWVPVWLYLFGVGKSQLCVLHHRVPTATGSDTSVS